VLHIARIAHATGHPDYSRTTLWMSLPMESE